MVEILEKKQSCVIRIYGDDWHGLYWYDLCAIASNFDLALASAE
jgi:hypothetical protein